jgi:hypothetical protein
MDPITFFVNGRDKAMDHVNTASMYQCMVDRQRTMDAIHTPPANVNLPTPELIKITRRV